MQYQKSRENTSVSLVDVTLMDSQSRRIGKSRSGSRNNRLGVNDFFFFSPDDDDNNRRLAIILGCVFGAIVLLILIVLCYFTRGK